MYEYEWEQPTQHLPAVSGIQRHSIWSTQARIYLEQLDVIKTGLVFHVREHENSVLDLDILWVVKKTT
jgi:hypothetical protein